MSVAYLYVNFFQVIPPLQQSFLLIVFFFKIIAL